MEKQTLKIALTGLPIAPKLFGALQLAHGLTNNWKRIAVIGSSPADSRFQYLGDYSMLSVSKDASPSRYSELLSLCVDAQKEAVIFSSFSDEWQAGVMQRSGSPCHEDLLRLHRSFLQLLRCAPIHIVGCIESRRVFLPKDQSGRRKLNVSEQLIQQVGVEGEFTTVLHLDKKGLAKVERDETGVFNREERFALNILHGCVLADYCESLQSPESLQMQQRIQCCTSIEELHKLLFDFDLKDQTVLSAFVKRRTELDEDYEKNTLHALPGGQL